LAATSHICTPHTAQPFPGGGGQKGQYKEKEAIAGQDEGMIKGGREEVVGKESMVTVLERTRRNTTRKRKTRKRGGSMEKKRRRRSRYYCVTFA